MRANLRRGSASWIATTCGVLLASCSGGSPVSGPSSGGGASGAGSSASPGAPHASGGSNDMGGFAGAVGGAAGASAANGFPPDYASGSRLRAMFWVAADQTRQFVSWYDRKLDTPCLFVPAFGEITRCLPTTPVVVDSDSTFADSACSQPLAQTSSEFSCLPHKYVRSWSDNAFYETGAPRPLTVAYKRAASCTPTPVEPHRVYYALGRKLDASELVAVHLQNIATGHRLNALSWVADDGATQRLGWYDTRLKTRCALARAADATVRCLPRAVGSNPYLFSDPRCTVSAVASVPLPDVDAVYVESQDEGTCETERSHVYSVGKQLTGPLFELANGSCVESTQQSDATFYASGSELDPQTFDEFDQTRLGTGRLRLAAEQDAEGALELPPPSRGITDTVLGTACAFGQTADGRGHCVPLGMQRVFSDASCSQPLGVDGGQACGVPFPQYVQWQVGDACAGLALAKLGVSSARPSAAFAISGVECKPTPASTAALFTVGAQVDPSTLASAQIITE